MMTPVYNVAIANWSTNSYSVNHCAVRLDFSVFFTTLSLENEDSLSRRTDLFTCFVHIVKKYSLRCFYFIYAETTKYNQRMQQPTIKNYLVPETSSKYDDSRNNLIHTHYSCEVNFLSYFNLAPYSRKTVTKKQVAQTPKKRKTPLLLEGFDTPADSERRETFEALIPAYFPFTGVRKQ